ncbi:MAG: hypothetical protein J5787_02875 [Alphaproteobacteria bacterium]|nr:hypothetical protein [Alphaproteobacteria bacterium]
MAAFFVLITQLVVLPHLRPSFYPDTDNYTHAVRILDLLSSRSWAEIPYMHTNYPFGEILHFTRVTDVFWLFFSLPLFPFLPVKEAVFWGGFLYQIGVLMLSAAALVWALKPVGNPLARLAGLCLFFIQPSITETYILIKPDHHVLTALFSFILTGGLIHYLNDGQTKHLKTAGISAGLCLWSSVEGLLISYSLLAGLIVLFLLRKKSLEACIIYCFYYFISALVCLIINPPYEGFFFPDNGRLSFLLVTIIGFTTVAMFILHRDDEKKILSTFWKKSANLILTAAFFVAVLFVIFSPSVVLKPYFSPLLKAVWAKNVLELQPGFKRPLIFFLGCWPAVLSLVVGLIAFKFCSSLQRSFLILTFVPLIFLTGLSSEAVRFSRLAALFTPFPFVSAFSVRLQNLSLSERKKSWALMVLYIGAALYLGINYLSVNRVLSRNNRPSVLSVKPYLPDGEGSILSDIFMGPEIVWFLEENAVGSPYHRNLEGIVDNSGMLHNPNEKDVLELMKKHRVKAILLYLEVAGNPSLFYDMEKRYSFFAKMNKADTLLDQLLSGKNLPCGIREELNTPPPYLLYTVDFSNCSDKDDTETKPAD